jgi:hypothetical protein
MITRLRMVLYRCGLAIAIMSVIAALTILTAIVTNKLPVSEAWMAVVFFAAVGVLSWTAGRAVK